MLTELFFCVAGGFELQIRYPNCTKFFFGLNIFSETTDDNMRIACPVKNALGQERRE